MLAFYGCKKNHVVSDQTFDSFVIFGRSHLDPRKGILTSDRKDPDDESDEVAKIAVDNRRMPIQRGCTPASSKEDSNRDSNNITSTSVEYPGRRILSRTTGILSSPNRIAPTPSEKFAFVGVVLGLLGFVLQFQGLRTMNWSASILQLVCIALMTILRAIVRRGLIVAPIPKKVFDQHEMDWLALRIATNGSDFWPRNEKALRCREECLRLDYHMGIQHNSSNKIKTNLSALDAQQQSAADTLNVPNFAGDESSNTPKVERQSWTILTHDHNLESNGAENSRPYMGKAQLMIKVRRRLGMLTGWRGKTSEPSIAVARSIDVAMNTLFDISIGKSVFYWLLNVRIGNHAPEYIKFKIECIEGKWKADTTEIEAALSLWLFHIRKMEGKSMGNETSNTFKGGDWLQRDVELRRQISRVLGPNTEGLRGDIGWWVGDGVLPDNCDNSARDVRGAPGEFSGPIGSLGSDSQMQVSGESSNGVA